MSISSQKLTLRMAIIFTILFATVFALLNYSAIGVAGLLKLTGGASILDFEFGYDYSKAQAILAALGASGREFYMTKIIPLDFIFPLTYMLCFASWITLLFKKMNTKKRFLLSIPVFAMIFDWIENIGIIGMLNTYEYTHSLPVFVASVAGIMKMIFITSSIVTILVLVLIFTSKRKRIE